MRNALLFKNKKTPDSRSVFSGIRDSNAQYLPWQGSALANYANSAYHSYSDLQKKI